MVSRVGENCTFRAVAMPSLGLSLRLSLLIYVWCDPFLSCAKGFLVLGLRHNVPTFFSDDLWFPDGA
jgi:hypothetical protein